MDRYILIGLEYNNAWKLPFYYISSEETLEGVDDIWNATEFTLLDAEDKRIELQGDFPDYTWYLLRLNK